MRAEGLTGQVAREYLAKYPGASLKMLARMMYRDNVALFNSVEHARSALRYRTGSNGSEGRKQLKDKTYVRFNRPNQ